MRVQVLGPLEWWREGVRVELGTPHQRTVLGMLLLADGRPLSRVEFADALWGDRQPPSVANLIQTYVKRLRRLLEPDRTPRTVSVLLPRVGEGYALRVPEDCVDVSRFRRLAGRAEAAQREHGPGPAAELLDEALRLWHGPPLADLPSLAVHPAVVALAGERRTAVARYGEAMLASGRAAEALPVLERDAGSHPLDEGSQARLVRAYKAVGRRDSAFTAYLSARRRLIEELGVDPGPELTTAYESLLRTAPGARAGPGASAGRRAGSGQGVEQERHGESGRCAGPGGLAEPGKSVVAGEEGAGKPGRPAVGAAAAVPPLATPSYAPGIGRDRRPAPAQLPPDVYGFCGRAADLRALDELLTGSAGTPAVMVVSGTAGVGKTAFVLHWAHRASARFPDGQL